ncbi:MAG: diguanylate cyclase [Firmicutes bacterium]|nr:diguanylate cyclase [Bacillota bacterium]
MNKWEIKRQEKLREFITVSFMMMALIVALAILGWLYKEFADLSSIPYAFVITLAIVGALTVFLGYFGHKILGQAILVDRPNRLTYLTGMILLGLIAIIVLKTGGAASRAKVLFFLPIIIFAGQHGRRFGLGLTSIIAIFLVSLDLVGFYGVYPNRELEVDLVNLSIMFLLSWLLGGLANIEKEVRQELSLLASQDDLTELDNHRSFQEKLDVEIQRAREQRSSVGLIMLDIDYFKFYNDTFGHQQGDEVLKQMGGLLKMEVPEPGFAARYGGEEFAIVLPGATREVALEIAEHIRQRIERFPFYGASLQPQGRLTASLGVALFPFQAKNKEELIRLADQALYRAKYASKNKVELYFSVLDELRDEVDESEQNLLTSIRTLISVINAKDRYTYGHSERTVIYATELAQALGWTAEKINHLKYGAFLHDIGKIEIGRDILNKPGVLTEEEWAILKQHPVWGAEIIRPISSLQTLDPIIRYHHENFDGTGYPEGLKGQEIPLAAASCGSQTALMR